MQIAGPGRWCRGYAALGVTGGLEIELARRGAVEKPAPEHAVLNHLEDARRDAFGIERPRSLAARPQRIVDDVDARSENLFAELFAQEACLAGDRGTVDG